MKVISGAQTGVDQAGLLAAEVLGIETGGWMPKGWLTNVGPQPELAVRFNLQEMKTTRYPPRTLQNVKDSDITILLGRMGSRGCKLTIAYCEQYNKPYLAVSKLNNWESIGEELKLKSDIHSIVGFLRRHRPTVINIAGNREETNPGIGGWAVKVLVEAFSKYNLEKSDG